MKIKLTPVRFILGLWAAALLFTLLAVTSGCRSSIPDLTTGRVRYERKATDGATLKIELLQPKDLEIGGINIDPQNGIFAMTNYSSIANQAALRARVDEAAQQREMFRDAYSAGREFGAMAATAWTGRDVRPPPTGAGAAGPLSPEAISQIVATLRALGIGTNSPATNRPTAVP